MTTVDTGPHMIGGWSGPCPVPDCRVHLQGRDARVIALHMSVVHPERLPTPPPTTPRRGTA